jgi:Anaphase-promoting complex subunit 5
MQVAKRVHLLAQQQNDSALILGAYQALVSTLFFLGDFEVAQQYAMCGVQLWRSGTVQSSIEQVDPPAVVLLCWKAIFEWHFGEIVSSPATMAEAVSLAKELNDMHGLAEALAFAGILGSLKRDAAEVDRVASDLIELSTRHHFAQWLTAGQMFRGWARSVAGDTAEGISWIENGIENWRAGGTTLTLTMLLALKAEALHFADRTSEALEAIREAEAIVERSEERWWCAELHRRCNRVPRSQPWHRSAGAPCRPDRPRLALPPARRCADRSYARRYRSMHQELPDRPAPSRPAAIRAP